MTHVEEPLDHEDGPFVLGLAHEIPDPGPYKPHPLKRALGRVFRVRDAVRYGLGTVPENFVSRAQWGATPPKSRSTNITPAAGGVAWHYEGPKMGTWTHDKCAGKVRQIQAFHMGAQRGWVDIAYSAVVCPHGYIYEGRGLNTRTAANGTNAGNQSYYAICGLLGEGDVLPAAMVEAYKSCTVWLRERGKAANRVKPHRFFKSTACPGDLVAAETTRWDGKVITTSFAPDDGPLAPKVPTHPHSMPILGRGQTNPALQVKDLQGHLNYAYRQHPEIAPLQITGLWDERTDIRFRDWQKRSALKVDGLCGPSASWPRLHDVTGGKRWDFDGKEW